MAVILPIAPNVTKNAHADANAVEYSVNPKTNRVTVLLVGVAGSMALTGTDGGALGADDWPLYADTGFSFMLDSGEDRVDGLKIFVTSAAPAVVHIFSEPD